MIILGLDPGKTTGAVLYDSVKQEVLAWWEWNCADEGYDPSVRGISALVVGHEVATMFSAMRHGFPVADGLDVDAIHTVVMEAWEFRHNDFAVDANYAAGPIGVVQWLCHDEGIDIVLQKPFKRSRVTDPQLKETGLWIRGGKGHARQALKHVLSYLLTQRDKATQEKLFPRS